MAQNTLPTLPQQPFFPPHGTHNYDALLRSELIKLLRNMITHINDLERRVKELEP